MRYKLQALSIFEFGQRTDLQGRPHQEDCLAPSAEALGEKDRLFVLCDGMGGHEAGETASATVCEAIAATVKASKAWQKEERMPDSVLREAVGAAYDALDHLSFSSEGRKPGTTMTLLALHRDGATIAHLGDSRVYHIRPGRTAEETKVLFCTRDHSLVNQLIDLGELTPAEAATFNRRNVITRAMQPALEVRFKPEIHHTIDIHPGDLFFLCSDGMLEHMDEQNLRYIFSLEGGDLRAKHDTLLRATAENTDNHSAFIILIEEVTGHAVAQADEEETLPPFGKAKQNAPAVMPPSEKEKSDESTAVKTAVPDGSYETAAPIVSETKEEANKKTAPPRHLAFSTILLGATIVIFLLAALLFFLF